MVMARLHIVCGNCGAMATTGSPDELKYKISPPDEDCPEQVYIKCENCSTVHNLSDTIPAE